jgi:transposase InsO family protein
MCQVLKVSRSGYYQWKCRPDSSRFKANEELLKMIRDVHRQSDRTYGSPRIYKQLKDQVRCSKNRVARIMRLNGIYAKTVKRFKVTTNSKHKYPVAANILNRQFSAEKPNQIWVSDITYIHTKEGFLYLAAIMDLYSRKIVGWAMDRMINTQLVKDALSQAKMRRNPPRGVIVHSDQGIQYASPAYQSLLKEYHFVPSMSRRGNCYDNACMESFFHTLKTELIYFNKYQTRSEAKQSIFRYIEVFYNRKRLHSSLGYKSPYDFEKRSSIA